jgi:hypothetical protein
LIQFNEVSFSNPSKVGIQEDKREQQSGMTLRRQSQRVATKIDFRLGDGMRQQRWKSDPLGSA